MTFRSRQALGAFCSALAAFALLAYSPLSAQTWSGVNSGSFSTASNWSGGSLPANDGTADLVFGSATNYGVTLDSSWSVNSLSFTSAATSGYSLNGSGSPTITVGSGGISDATGRSINSSGGFTIALPQNITYFVSSGTDFANWVFSGSGGITKTGSGTLLMGSSLVTNSGWTGSLTINAGIVQINADNKLGAVPGSATAGMINLNGGTFTPTTTLTISANRGIAVLSASTITLRSGNTTTYGGVMTGSAGLALTGGTLLLSGANTYSGTIAVGNSGTLKLGATNTLQNATVAANTGGLSFGVNAATIGALSGSRAISLLNGSNAVALTVGANNATTTYSGALSNLGSLIKSGTGTFTLGGANTYSGTTTVSAGTLLVNGSLGGSGAVSVNSGGTLGGTGSIAGLATVASGGALSAGSNGVGTLTLTQGLTLDTGSALNFDLGASSDKLLVSGGTLTGPGTAGGVTLNLFDTGTFTAGTYTLLDYTGASTASFDASSITLGTTISGYNYSLAVSGSTLQLIATTAVPEPSACAAVAGLAALALVVRRRRSARA